jgi:hypothetical protein
MPEYAISYQSVMVLQRVGGWHCSRCPKPLNTGYCCLVEPDERQSPIDCDMVRNMKAKFLLPGIAALPLVFGCNNAVSGLDDVPVIPPVAVATNAPGPVAAAKTNVLDKVEPPASRVVNTAITPPDSVKLSPAASAVVKMAQSGVESSVLLAYVANSVNTFQLAAEEIVYLKDIGVEPEVVSAMIQHDQQIREASLNGAMAASPATPAPNVSVWSNGQVADGSNTWQEIAAVPAPEADSQTTVPPPPAEEQPTETTVNYFYDSLAPYGTWIDIDGYGRCWRPSVVVATPGWRPYVDGGRWVWSDAGWYWYSDYTWGWAPFHYGRWFSHANWGWCWMPGTVWGPSWVSWRYNNSYCGWAPLPPAACYYPRYGFTYYGSSCGSSFSFGLTWDCFTFVSYNHFPGRYYNRYCATPYQAAQIYNNSTVVNNVINGDGNTIINQGIGIDRITAATRSEIPRAAIRSQPGTSPRGGRNETLAADGSAVTVVQHQVPGGRAPTRVASTAPATDPGTRPAPTLAAPATTSPGGAVRPRGGNGSLVRGDLATSGNRGSAPQSAPGAMSASAAPVASAPAGTDAMSTKSPSRPDVTRRPGALYIRGNPNAPATAQVVTEPSGSDTSSATPWLNNNSGAGSRPRPGANNNQGNASATRPGRGGGSTYARNDAQPQAPASSDATTPAPQPDNPSAWQMSRPTYNSSRPTTRSQGNDYGSPGTYNRPSAVPKASSYAPAPIQSAAPVYSPAQVTRIGASPAPRNAPSPQPSYSPAPRPAQPVQQGGNNAPGYSRPSSPAPSSAPSPRSASPAGANKGNGGQAPSRPGR